MMYGEHVFTYPRPIGVKMTDAVALSSLGGIKVRYWGDELDETALLNDNSSEDFAIWWQNWMYFLDLPPNADNNIRMALLGIQCATHLLGTTVTSQLLIPYVKVIRIHIIDTQY